MLNGDSPPVSSGTGYKIQKEHHREKTFQEEYIEFLKKYQIEYNDRYILKDIEKIIFRP